MSHMLCADCCKTIEEEGEWFQDVLLEGAGLKKHQLFPPRWKPKSFSVCTVASQASVEMASTASQSTEDKAAARAAANTRRLSSILKLRGVLNEIHARKAASGSVRFLHRWRQGPSMPCRSSKTSTSIYTHASPAPGHFTGLIDHKNNLLADEKQIFFESEVAKLKMQLLASEKARREAEHESESRLREMQGILRITQSLQKADHKQAKVRGEQITALAEVEHELRSRLEVARAVKITEARSVQLAGITDPMSKANRIPIPVIVADAVTQNGAGLSAGIEMEAQATADMSEAQAQTEAPTMVDQQQQFHVHCKDIGIDHKPETRDYKQMHTPSVRTVEMATEIGSIIPIVAASFIIDTLRICSIVNPMKVSDAATLPCVSGMSMRGQRHGESLTTLGMDGRGTTSMEIQATIPMESRGSECDIWNVTQFTRCLAMSCARRHHSV